MSRILRFGMLALLCAVPFALPQTSEARVFRGQRGWYRAPYHYGWHYSHWYGHRHFRR